MLTRHRAALIGAAVVAAALTATGCSHLLPSRASSTAGTSSDASTAPATSTATPGRGPSTSATMVTVPPLGTPDATVSETPGSSGQPPPSKSGTTSPIPSPSRSSPPSSTPSGPSSPDGATAHGVIVTAADRARAAAIVASMTTADRAASVIMVTGQQAIGTGLLARQHFGGVILFAPRGIVDGTTGGTPSQVAAVTAGLRKDASADPAGVPPLIATDQEYGAVQRLKNGFTAFPGESQLGAISNAAQGVSLTRELAAAAAQEMLAVGVTVNFAPVFGVLPANGAPSAIGRYGRSYGIDPHRVANLVAAAVSGYQHGGVVSAMKHFPGLARVAEDSHVTLPTLDVSCADWDAHEAIPAKAGVDAGALMVMTGHVLLPAVGDSTLPASISSDVVGKLLRGNGSRGCTGMNFGGVTVTDSLQMAPISAHYGSGDGAVAALRAGEDLLLMPADPIAAVNGIVAAVRTGTLSSARLDAAATAVLALRIASARVPRPPLSVVKSPAHQALADKARAAAR